eukprot:GAHX01001981.1.p1 GENE.GAHX01001981.1~~GAHX01001981.1.p1  ORF type:complete len:402 (-),score=69.51 GAHX01001981.1:70-1275(-)
MTHNNRRETMKVDGRYKLVSEMLTSEEVYKKSMLTFHDKFLEPLNLFLSTCSVVADEEGVVELFGKIQKDLFMIINISENFQVDLRDLFAGWQSIGAEDRCIGDFLEKFFHFFKCYSSYLTDFNSVLYKYKKFQSCKKYKKIQKTINTIAEDPEIDCIDFESFLIQPVQRLPRLKMLLDAIIKDTPESHKDYKPQIHAARLLESTIQHIQMIDKLKENFIICENISERLRINITQNNRFYFGEIKTMIIKPDAKKLKTLNNKFYNKELSCFMFNDFFIFAVKLKPFCKIRLSDSYFLRLKGNKWTYDEDSPVDKVETQVQMVTTKTTLIIRFPNYLYLKDFLYVANMARKYILDEKEMEEVAKWAISIQGKVLSIRKMNIETFDEELSNLEKSKVSTIQFE